MLRKRKQLIPLERVIAEKEKRPIPMRAENMPTPLLMRRPPYRYHNGIVNKKSQILGIHIFLISLTSPILRHLGI